jgi:hypothetical protein
MPYLIDGHNLIGKLPGISLRQLDDEEQLVELLRGYCQRTGRNIEVFFDNAPVGQARSKSFGRLKAIFVRNSDTADRAIARRLAQLGKGAANWTVVSSDRAVQAEGRRYRAGVVNSEEFARELEAQPAAKSEDATLTNAEVEDWLSIFKNRDNNSDAN